LQQENRNFLNGGSDEFACKYWLLLWHGWQTNQLIPQHKIFLGLLSVTQIRRRPRELSQYDDSLRAGWSGDRILVGMRFSALVQTTPRAQPTSCTMGIGSLSSV
jgi:hypothetical protein